MGDTSNNPLTKLDLLTGGVAILGGNCVDAISQLQVQPQAETSTI